MAGKCHGESTLYEDVVSILLQGLWLEIAKNPHDVLRNANWRPYGEGKAVLLGDEHVSLKQIVAFDLDRVCTTF